MKAFPCLLLLSVLLSACNTTPERRLDDALPGQPMAPARTAPQASTSPTAEAKPGPEVSASPVASPAPATSPASPAEAGSAEVLKQGNFRNGAHVVSGRAQLLTSAGKQYVRLEEFSTENGPDLYLYLVQSPDGKPRNEADFVSLGRLRATSGNQNYELPAGTDLSQIQAVTIWCKAFSVNFGYAPLPQ